MGAAQGNDRGGGCEEIEPERGFFACLVCDGGPAKKGTTNGRRGAAPRVGAEELISTFGSPVHAAAVLGSATDLRGLSRAGHSLTGFDAAGRTPCHLAALSGNLGNLQALVELGADLEAEDSRGDTPLMCAVNTRQIHVVTWVKWQVWSHQERLAGRSEKGPRSGDAHAHGGGQHRSALLPDSPAATRPGDGVPSSPWLSRRASGEGASPGLERGLLGHASAASFSAAATPVGAGEHRSGFARMQGGRLDRRGAYASAARDARGEGGGAGDGGEEHGGESLASQQERLAAILLLMHPNESFEPVALQLILAEAHGDIPMAVATFNDQMKQTAAAFGGTGTTPPRAGSKKAPNRP